MAVSTTFKQKCPSCQAAMTIREAKLIGKKVDCPKCKYQFVVEDPAKKAAKAAGYDLDYEQSAETTNGRREEVIEELSEHELQGLLNQKKVEKEPKPAEEELGKPKKAAKQKLTIGLALAGVGLVVLAAAGYFILSGKGNSNNALPNTFGKNQKGVTQDSGDEEPKDKKVSKDGGQPAKDKDGQKQDLVDDIKFSDGGKKALAGSEFTNLFPANTTYVGDLNVRDILSKLRDWRDAILLTPGAFKKDELDRKLGFPILATDRIIHTESPDGSLTAVHLTDTANLEALKRALSLESAGTPVKKQEYFKSTRPNPWFEVLSRLAIGVPKQAQIYRPLYVRIHDPQTIIFADEKPMLAFLNVGGQFEYQKQRPAPKAKENPQTTPNLTPPPVAKLPGKLPLSDSDPKKLPVIGEAQASPKQETTAKNQDKDKEKESTKPNDDDAIKPAASTLKSDTFMTIKPALKEMLDKMRASTAGSKDILLYCSASEVGALTLNALDAGGRSRDPRRFWDVLQVVHERKARMHILGTALIQKDSKNFRMKNEVACEADGDAKDLKKTMIADAAFTVGRFIERFLDSTVELPQIIEEAPAPAVGKNIEGAKDFGGIRPGKGGGGEPGVPSRFGGGGDPVKKDTDSTQTDKAAGSRVTVTQEGKNVAFTIDVVDKFERLPTLVGFAAYSLRTEVEVAAAMFGRHDLAKAGKLLGESGLTDRGVPPGQYPPGAFKASGNSRLGREPGRRISWMAGLLPFLGQERLYSQIDFNKSWRDPGNWMSARTLVPQFLDPMYPTTSFFAAHPDMPFEVAATHFVGISGVGHDAAEYPANDPAYINKRGILGYDKSATLDEIRNGHGLSSTILLIQVPHDGLVGATPWMAGGGSTLRGVPETKSISPFVLSTDKFGKPIVNNGKRGTYASFPDGSVRWIGANISDEVFKAMCTLKGPLPDNFDLDRDDNTPLISAPAGKKENPKGP
ncbi:MAG: DUF1559 domain-containing protein [Planctomycetes bacterium]|nr:DUF1559 domain-containing protein [Planctomycetota bacterium]